MKLLLRAAVVTLALLSAPALAQSASSVQAPSGYAPMYAPCAKQADGTCKPISVTDPQPTTFVTAPATSTPATNGAITAPTTLTFTPQLGRPIREVIKLVSGPSFSAQVFTSPDGCVTKNPLTIGGQVWASWTNVSGTINEDVDTPMISGISYCLTVTPASGATVSAAQRQ